MNSQKSRTGSTTDGIAKTVVLRLYIAGNAPNSALAVANLDAICREYLKEACDLEIVDVLEHPQRAMAAGILVTPTLSKLYPLPAAQVVGNLGDKPKVLLAIGIRSRIQ
jgi:circadian clock protein KaiB